MTDPRIDHLTNDYKAVKDKLEEIESKQDAILKLRESDESGRATRFAKREEKDNEYMRMFNQLAELFTKARGDIETLKVGIADAELEIEALKGQMVRSRMRPVSAAPPGGLAKGDAPRRFRLPA